jgi:hypothetical protein
MVCPCEHQKTFFRQISNCEDLEQSLCQILGCDTWKAAVVDRGRPGTDQDIL